MHWYKLDADEVLQRLHTSPNGLSTEEVKKRQLLYPPNIIKLVKEPSFFKIFLTQFKSFLPWLLVGLGVLALVSHYFLDVKEHYFDSIIIFTILIINALLGAYQDYKSSKAATKFEFFNQNKAIVIRNGKQMRIFASKVVPGDIIILKEGMKVPADARLLSTRHLDTDEAWLTGESHTRTRSPSTIKKEVPVGEQINMVFMNTHIKHGSGVAVVIGTGHNSEVGKVASTLKENYKNPFNEEIDTATNKITFISIILILLVVLVFVARGQPFTQILLMASALIIGAIPEGLPTVVTFALATGESALHKRKVLVKRKTLLETLGSVDVICTDKTGTLTCNQLEIKKIHIAGATSFQKISHKFKDHFAKAALLPNDAEITDHGFVGDPIDIAFIDYFNEKGFDIITFQKEFPATKFTPFSSEKKLVASTHRINKKNITYTKGASESILKKSSHIIEKNRIVQLTEKKRDHIRSVLKRFSKESLRNVALSFSEGKKTIFLGFVGLYDPPKADIKESIAAAYAAGIEVKMITGDSKETALSLAQECNFRDPKALDWFELRDLSSKQLLQVVEEYNIFSRMSPKNKLSVVKALEENGHRVAITGDGMNDAPALQEATVGIAMGDHSADIAKDAADMIVLNGKFSSIMEGVRQGRTIFSNIRKVINYLITSNLGEIIMVVIGSFFGLMPFLAVQLLWVNFVTTYVPGLALGTDPPSKGILNRKPTGKTEHLIDKKLTVLAVYIAAKKVLILSALFYGTLYLTNDLVIAQTMAFTWLILWHFVRVASIRKEEGASLFDDKMIFTALLIPLFFQFIILYTPISAFFRVIPLGLVAWSVLIVAMFIGLYFENVIARIVEKKVV